MAKKKVRIQTPSDKRRAKKQQSSSRTQVIVVPHHAKNPSLWDRFKWPIATGVLSALGGVAGRELGSSLTHGRRIERLKEEIKASRRAHSSAAGSYHKKGKKRSRSMPHPAVVEEPPKKAEDQPGFLRRTWNKTKYPLGLLAAAGIAGKLGHHLGEYEGASSKEELVNYVLAERENARQELKESKAALESAKHSYGDLAKLRADYAKLKGSYDRTKEMLDTRGIRLPPPESKGSFNKKKKKKSAVKAEERGIVGRTWDRLKVPLAFATLMTALPTAVIASDYLDPDRRRPWSMPDPTTPRHYTSGASGGPTIPMAFLRQNVPNFSPHTTDPGLSAAARFNAGGLPSWANPLGWVQTLAGGTIHDALPEGKFKNWARSALGAELPGTMGFFSDGKFADYLRDANGNIIDPVGEFTDKDRPDLFDEKGYPYFEHADGYEWRHLPHKGWKPGDKWMHVYPPGDPRYNDEMVDSNLATWAAGGFEDPKPLPRLGRTRFGKWVPSIPGENPHHLPGHNFTGPGTHAEERIAMGIKPTNAVDESSMFHDLAYTQISKDLAAKRISEAEAIKQITEADIDLLKRVTKLPAREIPDDGSADMVKAAMYSKIAAEKLHFLNPLHFVTKRAMQDILRSPEI